MPSAIFLGSKPGSVVALSLLLNEKWTIKCVIVPKGLTYDWIGGPNLRDFASINNIPVYESQLEIPLDENADFVISYMYRNLVKNRTLSMAKIASLNFHAGPLPRFGGWAFYNLAILEEVAEYGCTCHYMDDNFDTGPILKVRKFPINASEETAFSLEKKTQIEMILLFREFLELVKDGKPLPIADQIKEEMRYLNAEEFAKLKEIPSNADEFTMEKYARAFWYPPYECAYIKLNGVKLEIIPKLAKLEIAKKLHDEDFTILNETVYG